MPTAPKYHRPSRPKPSRKREVKQRFLQSKMWRAIRKRFLARNPVCEDCGQVATEVHHRDDTHRSTEDNLQALCKSCHSKRTNVEQGGVGKPKTERPEAPPRQWDENFSFG